MKKNTPENEIINYLEKTYDETFEVENVKEGSPIFKSMYGSDKVIVHPEGKPENVFLAGEKRDHEGEYYDTYVLSKWSNELTKKFDSDVKSILPGDFEYRALVYVEDGKYDSSMKDMSVFKYFANKNQDADVVLKIAVKTSKSPDVTEYYEPVYRLLQLLKTLNIESYGVSVGFVDSSEDISDYIRTSNINNVPWTNLDAKVYGTIMVDNLSNITESDQIKDYYEKVEE
ncbi:hypothetical protein [Neobacillus bataviensis]|uniref:hypothetical protein n=1 Tax=Neobacillus bataviensis TaxID=220685 RepID=UPI001CBC92CF|nr:hypothetical protein [Neobacillus bataviensis]